MDHPWSVFAPAGTTLRAFEPTDVPAEQALARDWATSAAPDFDKWPVDDDRVAALTG